MSQNVRNERSELYQQNEFLGRESKSDTKSRKVPTLLFFCKHLQVLHEVSVAFPATLQPSGDLSSKTRASLLKVQPGGWVSIWRGSYHSFWQGCRFSSSVCASLPLPTSVPQPSCSTKPGTKRNKKGSSAPRKQGPSLPKFCPCRHPGIESRSTEVLHQHLKAAGRSRRARPAFSRGARRARDVFSPACSQLGCRCSAWEARPGSAPRQAARSFLPSCLQWAHMGHTFEEPFPKLKASGSCFSAPQPVPDVRPLCCPSSCPLLAAPLACGGAGSRSRAARERRRKAGIVVSSALQSQSPPCFRGFSPGREAVRRTRGCAALGSVPRGAAREPKALQEHGNI